MPVAIKGPLTCFEHCVHCFCVAHKESGVPQKFLALDEHFGKLQVGLFCKRLHFGKFVALGFAHLYVAVACVGRGRLDADSYELSIVCSMVERSEHLLLEALFIDNVLVGRCKDDVGIAMARADYFACPCGGRGGG